MKSKPFKPVLANLCAEAEQLGKPAWRPVLQYVAELHGRSILAPTPPFEHAWEEIGPGYCGSPCFGHWDIVHQILDTVPAEPVHARNQMLNNLASQLKNGFLPGTIWMRGGKPKFKTHAGHPPVWPFGAEQIFQRKRDLEFLRTCYDALLRQIGWFNRKRKTHDGGFYYLDICGDKVWESGIDDGIRFRKIITGPSAMVDATSHVYAMHQTAALWAERLKEDPAKYAAEAARLETLIQTRMFDDKIGLFQDAWRVDNNSESVLASEGIWPVVVGAATQEQAMRVIDENLLNPERFFTKHPIPSVGASDPLFELRLWCGPTWNSLTYWAATGCMRYGRADAARKLLAAALDQVTKQFRETGTIWEFYHPHGGHPTECERKPYTKHNAPCLNYLGHNPLLAMARLWQAATK